MSSDFNIKPAGPLVAAQPGPPQHPAAEDAVATELPAHQTAGAIDAAVPPRNDAPGADRDTSKHVMLDREEPVPVGAPQPAEPLRAGCGRCLPGALLEA